METILIIEDDSTLMRVLKDNFTYAGYHVLSAADGEAGLNTALEVQPDLILLDIMLPKINGYEICRLLRQENLEMPIVMLTAKGEESDVILGLNLGADDYVTKPFSIKELVARVNSFLRRKRKNAEEVTRFTFGHCELDVLSCEFHIEGQLVELTPKELKLLEYFVRNPNRALTREMLLNAVWGYSTFVTERSVDRCVTTLRNKIDPNTRSLGYIHTIRSVGYKFMADAQDGA